MKLFWGLNKMIYGNYLVQCLTYSEYLRNVSDYGVDGGGGGGGRFGFDLLGGVIIFEIIIRKRGLKYFFRVVVQVLGSQNKKVVVFCIF